MRANEAPEKIWMDLEWIPHFDCKDCITEYSIEYARTDAFIEKAAWWLLTNASDYVVLHNSYDAKEMVKDFVEAMKRD